MSATLLNFRNQVSQNIQSDERITKDVFEAFISVVASIGFFAQGFIITQSDLLLSSGLLLQYEPKVQERAAFESHFLTILFVGELFGALSCFLFADEFGRKNTLFYSSLLCALSALWYLTAGSADGILIAKFFLGVFLGPMLTVCPIYVAEIASASSRGQCVGLLALNLVVGSLLAVLTHYLFQEYALGWRVSLLLPALLLVAEAGLLFFLPDSPRWVLAQKTPAKCLQAMRQLRRTPEVSKEFNEVYRALTVDAKLGHDWADLLTTKSVLLRLILVGVLEMAHLCVGKQLIAAFSQQLFTDFGDQSAILGLLLVLLAKLLGTGVFLMNVDVLGRRPLLLSGCGMMGLAWLCAAVCVYIASLPQQQRLFLNPDEHTHRLALTAVYATQFFFGCALCVFAFAFALSVGSVTWVYCAEVFPYRTRAKAGSACMAVYFLSSALSIALLSSTISIADVGVWGLYYNNPGVVVTDMNAFAPYYTQHDASVSIATASQRYFGTHDAHSLDVVHQHTHSGGKHHHHHQHTGSDGIVHGSTVITPDYSATVFLLQLALTSLALGLFVYLFIPETKDLRLELMDELFRVDTPTTACCNCCPDMRTAGLIGLRALTEQQKGTLRSATKVPTKAPPRAQQLQSKDSKEPSTRGSFTSLYQQPSGSASQDMLAMSISGDEGGEGEEEDFDDIVPSALHKYSARMHGSRFSYFTEEEPLVVPSFNLNV